MFYSLVQTRDGLAPLFLRLGLAICIFPHGAQKAMGWFDGAGFETAMDYFTSTLGAPYFLGVLVIGFEFVGTIALVLGLLTRIWAFGIGVTLVVAASTHASYGFFMNWFGDKGGEGFEYHILAVAMAFALFFFGSGSFSIDRKLSDWSV
ncbi:DoxX family protein [Leptospira langatensis]|uniref:DoxX family protein n=1 Tax=Leptospira langatensis TaxID=2484983 RepID=A0A5F1ZVL3_9LEPT|nr:DoxX family protein [Leptospira langatensis]TGK02873.1 DoxX family protein [Leptospira langatensis]TGL41627.1 DoxX family protein [Leptospira langatensis]